MQDKNIQRTTTDLVLEKIPPLVTWILIFFPVWGALFFPIITAYFVIIFNVYFLYKSVSFTLLLFVCLVRIREAESINWLTRLQELDNIPAMLDELSKKLEVVKEAPYSPMQNSINRDPHFQKIHLPGFLQRFIFFVEKRKAAAFVRKEINRLRQLEKRPPLRDWKELHHVIIIPHWKEPESVLDDTLGKLKSSNYPSNRITIVLAAEERDPEGIAISNKLQQKYHTSFEHFWVTTHTLAESELIGKSSNMASAGKYAREEMRKLNWDLRDVIVTSCDADSKLPPDYLANIAYFYVTDPKGIYKFYNAGLLLYSNIWRLPFYARVKNSMSTIYNVGRLVRNDKLVPFSTYSASFWLIDQIGYWTPYITPEDFHIYFKALFKFPFDVVTVPVYQRILADAAEGDTHLETLKNNYFQERRWSWGISDDGWLIKQSFQMLREGKLPFTALYRTVHVIIDHIMGPVLTIIIIVGGNIPLLINPQFANTVLGVNLPHVSSFMIQLTLWFLMIAIALDFFLRPRPEKDSWIKRILRILEWIAQPFAGIFLAMLPGLEAHTRLLFGRYLEYYLTKKKAHTAPSALPEA